jgi:hypothetical protein
VDLSRLLKNAAAIAVIVAAAAPAIANATVYDVRNDWNGANPDGVWSFNAGAVAVTNVVANWQGLGVNAFAPSANAGDYLPAFFQANQTGANTPNCGGACDWAVGDLIVHTTDGANGSAHGPSNVLFIAPTSGTADISGLTWNARTFPTGENRPQDWALLVNGVQQASGVVTDLGLNGSSAPDTFSLSNVALNAGDQVELLMSQDIGASFGNFVGYDLSVTLTPTVVDGGVPEPGVWAMMLVGFFGAGAMVRRRRQAFA